jgi:YHS domain-containing protein
MEIDPTTALSATHQGKTYYFCSEENKAKFLQDPARYTAPRS